MNCRQHKSETRLLFLHLEYTHNLQTWVSVSSSPAAVQSAANLRCDIAHQAQQNCALTDL